MPMAPLTTLRFTYNKVVAAVEILPLGKTSRISVALWYAAHKDKQWHFQLPLRMVQPQQ